MPLPSCHLCLSVWTLWETSAFEATAGKGTK